MKVRPHIISHATFIVGALYKTMNRNKLEKRVDNYRLSMLRSHVRSTFIIAARKKVCCCTPRRAAANYQFPIFKIGLKIRENKEMVYGHLQQSHLQQPGFCGPPKFRSFAAKLFAAVICSNQNRSFAAKPFAAVICSNHLQQK